MNKFRFTTHALALAIFMIALGSAAHAQASRTWVSGVGDDANPCSRTAPCKTFAGSISKTAVNGEINCLDPGGFGAVTITKSITIDCHEVFGSILNAGTNGINIPFDNFTAVGETRKTVRLRNINFNGFDSGLIGINISGSSGTTGTKVFIEDCMLDGDFGGSATGIKDARSGGGQLTISNTTVRDMGGSGILVNPAGGATSGSIKVAISNSRVSNCGAFGVAATFGSKTTIYNTVVTGNNVGLHVDSASATSTEMAVDHCVVSNNTTNGFEATSASTTIRVSNTTAMNNGTLAAASGGGAVSSYGNNQTGGQAFPSTGTSPS